MSAELNAVRLIAQQIMDDCTTDAKRRDGQALTGLNVATALGEIGAQVMALAHLVTVLADQIEARP